jgi:hypothetical protein
VFLGGGAKTRERLWCLKSFHLMLRLKSQSNPSFLAGSVSDSTNSVNPNILGSSREVGMQSATNIRLKGLASGFISEFIEGRKNAYSVELLKSRMGYLRQLGLSSNELVILMQGYAKGQKKDVYPAIEKMRGLLLI